MREWVWGALNRRVSGVPERRWPSAAVAGLAVKYLSSRRVGCRLNPGGVAEWLKASRLKRDDRKVRGFESYPLRHTVAALRPRKLQM